MSSKRLQTTCAPWVWGRRSSEQLFKSLPHATPLVALEREYWINKASVVLPLQMDGVMGKSNGEVSCLQNGDNGTRYRDLHLAKSEALRWMRTHGYRFHGLQRADRDRRAERYR